MSDEAEIGRLSGRVTDRCVLLSKLAAADAPTSILVDHAAQVVRAVADLVTARSLVAAPGSAGPRLAVGPPPESGSVAGDDAVFRNPEAGEERG